MDTCACICLTFIVLVGLALFGLLISMDSLEPLEYGITYNKFTKTVGTEIYDSGRYIIGPWMSFIVYPANLVSVEFSDSRRATVS